MKKATIKRMAQMSLAAVFMVVFSGTVAAQYTFYGDNVIVNGDFSSDSLTAEFAAGNDTTAWAVEGDQTKFDAGIINGELAFTNMQETANQYDFQVNQPFTADQIAELAKGGTFEMTFDARTTADEKTFHVFLGEVGGGWARYWDSPGDGDVTVTNEMGTYTLTTDIEETWDAMRLGFEVATDTSSLFIDNIVLRRVSENILKDGELIVGDSISGNWILQGDGSNATFSNDNGALRIADLNIEGLNTFEIQFRQELDSVQIDSIYSGPYEISFDAKSTVETREIQVFVGNNGTGGDWTNFAGASMEITDVMTNYTLPLDVSQNWANMKVGFEVAHDTSGLWFDNVILKRVREIAPEAPTFALSSTENGIVTVTVDEVPNAATYDVYFSESDFSVSDSATYVGTIDPELGLTLDHTTTAPHPNFAVDFTAYYGVVAKSAKGTPSDVATNSVETSMSAAENYAFELSTEAETALIDAFGNQTIPEGSALASFFPEGYTPFTIDENSPVTIGSAPTSGEDLTAKFWVGFRTDSQVGGDILVVYADIVDDSVIYATEADGSGGAWNFDSYEMGIGNYTPESFIKGSTHATGQGGAEPDWQMRGGGLIDAAGDFSVRGFIHAYGYTAERIDGEIPNSQTLIEQTDNGYRTLTLITTANMASGEDVAFDFPTGEEVDLYPFQIAMNDADESVRDDQIAWSSAAISGDWWQNPFQWSVVAFVGADAVPVSNENLGLDMPKKITLDQNYPNPFNPTTNINFTLPANADVTLEVFNVLGQKVATLINNKSLNAGSYTETFNASSLSSGLYFYRLNVGSSFTSSKKMMLIK